MVTWADRNTQKHFPSASIFNTTGLREIHSWITVMPRPLAFQKSQLKDCNLSRTSYKILLQDFLQTPGDEESILLLFSLSSIGCLFISVIDFKVFLLVYKALNGVAPFYISDSRPLYHPARALRSSYCCSFKCTPCTTQKKYRIDFTHHAPKLWNTLPKDRLSGGF